jgi:hypothetical protein
MSQNQAPALSNLYLAHIPHSKYIFANGDVAVFTGGRYVTSDERYIAELDALVAKGHPGIYVDPNARQIDPAMLDPMAVMKAKIIAEFLEEQRIAAATQDPSRNMGSSDTKSNLNVGTSQSMAVLAAGGNGATPFKPAAIPASLLPGAVPASLAAALSLDSASGTIPPAVSGTAPNKEEVETQLSLQALGNAFSDPAGQPVAGKGLKI